MAGKLQQFLGPGGRWPSISPLLWKKLVEAHNVRAWLLPAVLTLPSSTFPWPTPGPDGKAWRRSVLLKGLKAHGHGQVFHKTLPLALRTGVLPATLPAGQKTLTRRSTDNSCPEYPELPDLPRSPFVSVIPLDLQSASKAEK